MDSYQDSHNVRRLAQILSIQARVEGMKAANSQHQENQPYTEVDFFKASEELSNLAYCHDDQL